MRLLPGFKSSSAVGLDIASGEIRLILLRKKLSKLTIEKWAIGHFPLEAIQDGKMKAPEEITKQLKKMVDEFGLKGMQVVIALPSHCVISKRLKLPIYFKEEECASEIIEHLHQYFPGIDEKLSFDFVVVNKREEVCQELLLFAARQAQMNAYVRVVEDAGLLVKIVDVDAYALVRAARWTLNLGGSPQGFLYFNQGIQFMLVDNGEVISTHALLIDLCVDDALVILNQQIKSILQMRSLSMNDLERLIFVGEMPFKRSRFQNEFGENIQFVNGFQSMSFPGNDDCASRLTVSFGLALRGLAL